MEPNQVSSFKDAVSIVTNVGDQAGNVAKRFAMGVGELKAVIDKMNKEYKKDKSLVPPPPAYTDFVKASGSVVDAAKAALKASDALEKMVSDKKLMAEPLNKVWPKVLNHARAMQNLVAVSAGLVQIYENKLPMKKTLPPGVESVKAGFIYLEKYKQYLNDFMKALAKVK